jgi:hypothetical protein
MVYVYEVVWLCLCSEPFFYFAYGKVDFLSLVLVRYTYSLFLSLITRSFSATSYLVSADSQRAFTSSLLS